MTRTAAPSRLAVIGTGIMGGHMARRLALAGFSVAAWNRDQRKLDKLGLAGVKPRATVAEALEDAEVAIVMLSTGEVVDDILFRPDADGARAVESLAAGSILVVMSSIPVETCRRQAEMLTALDIGYVDAPVSGGEVGARDGTLAILAGGEPRLIEQLAPVFEPLGRATRMGPVGAGQATKLANQIIVGGTMVAVAEALHFASRNGAEPGRVRAALSGGFGESRVLHLHGTRMVERDFVPGSPAEYQLKDLRTAQKLAGTLGLRFTLLDTLAGLFADMVQHEGTGIDVSGILLEVERRAGAGAG